jgi:hypothetical protein
LRECRQQTAETKKSGDKNRFHKFVIVGLHPGLPLRLSLRWINEIRHCSFRKGVAESLVSNSRWLLVFIFFV